MEALFAFLCVVCVIYFIVITVYSGLSASYLVWIFFAVIFGFMAWFCGHRQNIKGGLPARLPVFVFTTFAAAVAVFVCLMTPVLRTASAKPQQGLSYVIVLGAKVYPDRLSSSLVKRLDQAWEYYQDNPRTAFVLSGGQGPDEPVPEALAMYNYLYGRGVPARNMMIEIFSENTEENIRFSMAQIANDERHEVRGEGPEAMGIGILSSDFHVYRAMAIARHAGYENISPIAAPSDPILFLHLCVRECAAILKDHIMGNLSLAG